MKEKKKDELINYLLKIAGNWESSNIKIVTLRREIALLESQEQSERGDGVKESAEDILNKHKGFVPKDKRCSRVYYLDALDAMQEYAEQYHRDRIREELMDFLNWFRTEICDEIGIKNSYFIDKYLTSK